jgi:hypothetical protein
MGLLCPGPPWHGKIPKSAISSSINSEALAYGTYEQCKARSKREIQRRRIFGESSIAS